MARKARHFDEFAMSMTRQVVNMTMLRLVKRSSALLVLVRMTIGKARHFDEFAYFAMTVSV